MDLAEVEVAGGHAPAVPDGPEDLQSLLVVPGRFLEVAPNHGGEPENAVGARDALRVLQLLGDLQALLTGGRSRLCVAQPKRDVRQVEQDLRGPLVVPQARSQIESIREIGLGRRIVTLDHGRAGQGVEGRHLSPGLTGPPGRVYRFLQAAPGALVVPEHPDRVADFREENRPLFGAAVPQEAFGPFEGGGGVPEGADLRHLLVGPDQVLGGPLSLARGLVVAGDGLEIFGPLVLEIPLESPGRPGVVGAPHRLHDRLVGDVPQQGALEGVLLGGLEGG